MVEVVELARARKLVSNEHLSVDGTLLEAWAWRAIRGKKVNRGHRMIPAIRR